MLNSRSPALSAHLASLCYLCKSFLPVFQSFLYECVHLKSFPQAQSFCKAIADKPDLACHVGNFVCDGLTAVKNEDLFMMGFLEAPEAAVVKQLVQFIREAPHLHSVQLIGVDLCVDMAEAIEARKEQLRNVAVVECSPCGYKTLTSLIDVNPSVLCIPGSAEVGVVGAESPFQFI